MGEVRVRVRVRFRLRLRLRPRRVPWLRAPPRAPPG